MTIKVAIVEDKIGIREHWDQLLRSTPGFECVGVCASAEMALRELPAKAPDVVLMDINLPGTSGIKCTARLRQVLPGVRIVMVTVYGDAQNIFEALQAGASGYLLKRASDAELLQAIAGVMQGGGPMSGEIARRVIESFQRPAAPAGVEAQLTPRESEVLSLTARGFASKEIADQLGISVRTVSLHLQHIYEKLHVRSRTEAAAKYFASQPPHAR